MEQRNNYKLTWDELAKTSNSSKTYVAGYLEEEKFEKTAKKTISVLQETTKINQSDIVVEIGCGVGRVGKPRSKLCKKWIGTEIS